ncbi:MAG: hypothetical protein FJ037_01350 [Chloroflexi bacterium]|nr:hypothetical protein [Chloroflexota bacterium]
MERLELKKEWAPLYTARKKPDLIEVPPRRALTIAETRPPGAETMGPIFATLYSVAYTLKFQIRAEQSLDYPVLPPEAVFRIADFKGTEDWRWTASIAVPDAVDTAALRRAIRAAREKHPETPLLDRVKLAALPSGAQARIMHIGAFDQGQPTIDGLMAFIREAGYRPGSRHIEVYLSDPARVPPERTRTVIRMAVIAR